MAQQGSSLHDQLAAAYDKTVGAPEPSAAEPAPEPTTSAPAVDTAATSEGKSTEGRARDEGGKFVKQDEPKTAVKDAPKAPAASRGFTAAPIDPKLGVKRPDSWKKELWPVWDKLDAGEALTRDERKLFMEYLPQREGEYLKGVSTYKAEAENAREMNEAVGRYQDLIQQAGMRPAEFVSSLAEAHRTLSSGDVAAKLQFFAKLAQDYRIPVHQMLVQGQDGKVYFNKEYQQQQPARGEAPDVRKTVMDTMHEMMAKRDLQDFVTRVGTDGQKLHPHYEEVRATMDGLLRSGLAQDIPSAYEAALRLPKHQALFDGLQQEKQKAETDAKAKEEADRVARARANAASPRSSTPTGSTEGGGKKGLRQALESAYDTHVTGRI